MSRMKSYMEVPAVIEGHNGTIGTTQEGLTEYSQNLIWDTINAVGAATKVQLTSSSAADAAAGTGAQKIEIIGCDINGNPISEVVTLNGQAYVESALSYYRVFGAAVEEAGSGRVNAGDIHIIKTGTGGTLTAGVPATLTSGWVKIPVGLVESFSGMCIVPPNKSLRAVRLEVVSGAQGAVVLIFTRNLSITKAPLVPRGRFLVGANQAINFNLTNLGLMFSAGTQIELKASGLAASANVWAKLTLGH